MSSRLSVTIDLAAIADNWRYLQNELGAGRECGAVVKANAYGLGLAPVARQLADAGCRTFFVANVSEGIALRDSLAAFPDSLIYVLQGALAGDEPDFLASQLRPVLISAPMVRRWAAFAADKPTASCAVKVNTGMNRLGVEPAELTQLLAELSPTSAAVHPNRESRHNAAPCFWREQVTMLVSHLACADMPEHALNSAQWLSFSQLLAEVRAVNPAIKGSFANSSGIFLGQAYGFDVARPGAALYGINPTPQLANPMRPVVYLRLPIVQVRVAEPGSYVGYGAQSHLPAQRRLAVVAGGYADGVFRAAFPALEGYLQGQRVPIVGRVSMDTITFDVTEIGDVREGDEIELLGEHVSADQQGQFAGTIGYEILTSLGARVRRIYLGERTPEGAGD
ncbi:MAG TPA: alanine racemase [Marinagarivorans sp.]